MSNSLKILVTGGAGYIGSQTVKLLSKQGFEIIILDNLSYGHPELVQAFPNTQLVVGDCTSRSCLDQVFKDHNIAAVIHFAAYINVGESVTNPAKYYQNNVLGTLTLLWAMIDSGVKHLVFSSTCAIYGFPEIIPIPESHSQAPINPYGKSKLMVEQMLADFDQAYGLKSIIFRYFNAAGADPEGQLGEDHNPETHLIPLVLQTALGKRDAVSIFGSDYPTPDGTCIRDYIHVVDLAQAHILGLQHLMATEASEVFNLGNGNGFSVQAVIETARNVTGKPIPAIACERRAGDPPVLVGSAEKAKNILGWQPQYPELRQIIEHAWQWHQKRHG